MKSSLTLKKIDDASCSFPNKVRNVLFGLCRVWIKYKRWESERMIRKRTHGSYTHTFQERERAVRWLWKICIMATNQSTNHASRATKCTYLRACWDRSWRLDETGVRVILIGRVWLLHSRRFFRRDHLLCWCTMTNVEYRWHLTFALLFHRWLWSEVIVAIIAIKCK